MSLTLLFLDEFNAIMGIRLFLKLRNSSKVIIQVVKLENLCNSATKPQKVMFELRKYISKDINKANYRYKFTTSIFF